MISGNVPSEHDYHMTSEILEHHQFLYHQLQSHLHGACQSPPECNRRPSLIGTLARATGEQTETEC